MAVLPRFLPLALVLGLAGPASAHAGPSLRPVQAELSAVTTLEAEPTAACRQQVLDELVEGRRRDDACGEDRELAGRALVRRRDAFGYVERRVVELATLQLVLGEASRCRSWPLRSPSRDVLRRTDVSAAGCRLRRYQGPIALTFVDRRGRRTTPLAPLTTDRDGRLVIRFASLDQALRALGQGELADYARIELGDEAWAGHVDLEQLLRFRADWHLTWVRRGRGAPGLFALGHPEHPEVDEANAMAADALLSRQEDDLQRVERGELRALDYLDRHPWSPYRRKVEAWLGARARPQAQRPSAGSEGDAEGDATGAPEGGTADGATEPEATEGGTSDGATPEAGSVERGRERELGARGGLGPSTEPPGGGRRGGAKGGIGP